MRAIVSVATGRYVRGLDRLTEWCARNGEDYQVWRDRMPGNSPTHQEVPYAFKAYALKYAGEAFTSLLWADACILPIQPLEPLWERIERDGYWIGNQAGPEPDKGYSNYEWTADAAYAELFPKGCYEHIQWNSLCVSGTNPVTCKPASKGSYVDWCRMRNRSIPHVVATTFGISLAHPAGRAILDEYYRLAQTKAFCGPWINTNQPTQLDKSTGPGRGPCGPFDVRGHRHDQTALSVIAWRLGCKLTRWPEVFCYRGHEDERTILVADGAY